MRTVEYKVGFKNAPGDLQETLTFKAPEAAYAFAIKIETNGGVAVVMPGYVEDNAKNVRPAFNWKDGE